MYWHVSASLPEILVRDLIISNHLRNSRRFGTQFLLFGKPLLTFTDPDCSREYQFSKLLNILQLNLNDYSDKIPLFHCRCIHNASSIAIPFATCTALGQNLNKQRTHLCNNLTQIKN